MVGWNFITQFTDLLWEIAIIYFQGKYIKWIPMDFGWLFVMIKFEIIKGNGDEHGWLRHLLSIRIYDPLKR